jgi:hypothetical protein
LLAGCIEVGEEEPEFDPSELHDNGGSSGSAGSSGSGGSGGSSGSSGSGGSGGSSGEGGSAGAGGSAGSSSNIALDVELYQGFHTQEPCNSGPTAREQCLDQCTASYDTCVADDGEGPPPDPYMCSVTQSECQQLCPPEQSVQNDCVYANVYFLVTCNDANVHDLAPQNVEVRIGNKEVGVEGDVLLTQQNGLQVDLLLDRSYSIAEAEAESTVREAALGFLAELPDEARVRVSAFASEAQVPQVLGSNGDSYYYEVGTEGTLLNGLITSAYAPYSSASSVAFTKLFDAAVGLVDSAGVNDPSLAALPSVGIIFTDGADTASTSHETAAEARSAMTAANGAMKVYAIGLGNAIDQQSLTTLSDGRSYAADDDSLGGVFREVASELGAIYRYRVLVPSASYQAAGKLTVNHCGETSETYFTMDSIGSSTTSPPEGGGGNSCIYAYDDECDEPQYCAYGTDSADCN